MKGSAVETVGNLTGSQDWAQSGKQEHAQGEAEYNAAQAKGYVEGTKDRIGGRKDAVVGAVTGDRQQEAQGACRVGVWQPRGILLTTSLRCRQCPPRQGRDAAGLQPPVLDAPLLRAP